MSEINEQFKQSQQNMLVFIWKNRKLIIGLSVLGFVVSLVISLLLTPIFRSTAIVFPTATSTVSFSEQRNAKASSMDFGESEQAEQMVQILQSASIRDKIVSEFDLYKHYEIKDNDPNKHYKLGKKFGDNFVFARTRYGSISIDVFDKDPEKAAAMANRIVDLIDTVKNEMIQQRTSEAYKIAQRKRDMLQMELNTISNQIDSLANIGVMNIDARAGLYQALVDAKNPGEKSEIKQKLQINEKDGALYDKLEHFRREKIAAYELFMAIYEQTESDAHTHLNHKFIVERAVVPDKKDKPKRLVVVLLGTLGTALFSVFALLVRDKIRELKQIA
ncbi:MAG: Wzz/FepE/Etk N-terminal domain-containing protein [Crocinitomicaceae bacterium]|nr:Wzz/FepE/Etk N-terminal domain-containing protein [Crocinitomicaceae bacterium]